MLTSADLSMSCPVCVFYFITPRCASLRAIYFSAACVLVVLRTHARTTGAILVSNGINLLWYVGLKTSLFNYDSMRINFLS